MTISWQSIYWKWVNKGYDPFWATWVADEWERKQEKKKAALSSTPS